MKATSMIAALSSLMVMCIGCRTTTPGESSAVESTVRSGNGGIVMKNYSCKATSNESIGDVSLQIPVKTGATFIDFGGDTPNMKATNALLGPTTLAYDEETQDEGEVTPDLKNPGFTPDSDKWQKHGNLELFFPKKSTGTTTFALIVHAFPNGVSTSKDSLHRYLYKCTAQ